MNFMRRMFPRAGAIFVSCLVAGSISAAESQKPSGLPSRPESKSFLQMPPRADGALPKLLSQTGAFKDVFNFAPTDSLIPYDLIVPTVSISHVNGWTSAANAATLAISPATVGDVLLVTVIGPTRWGISGGGVFQWIPISYTGAGVTYLGIVTTADPAVITIPAAATLIVCDEFTAATTAATWSVTKLGTGTSTTGPALVPPNTLGELGYYVWKGSGLAAGSTPGFSYLGSGSHVVAYDDDVVGSVDPAVTGAVSGCTGLLLAAAV